MIAAFGGNAVSRWPGTETVEVTSDLDAWHTRYADRVFAYVALRVPSRADAEDITVEVFEAALLGIARFRPGASPLAWLLGIARRKAAEHMRRRGRQRECLEVELAESERAALGEILMEDAQRLPEDAAITDEARRVMRQLLDRLPEAQREALLLQVVHDLSIREVAEVLGRSVAATNSLLQRARSTLFRLGHAYFQE